jgi:three-Cys-motif partner protein
MESASKSSICACKPGSKGRVELERAKPLMENAPWWKLKAKNLARIAAPVEHIQPEQMYLKPEPWPLIKLVWLQYSLGFYATFMANLRARRRIQSVHFVDTCAGSGLNRFVNSAKDGDEMILAGTALVGAQDCRFTWYHFVEPKKQHREPLEARLEKFIPEKNYTVYSTGAGKAIEEIDAAISATRGASNFMAFVDPEGFKEVTLDHLAPLLDNQRGDLFFNFQNQMAARGGMVTEAVRSFFADPQWQAGMGERELTQYFRARLAQKRRPNSSAVTVEAGGGIRYSYDVVWCASETTFGQQWMGNFQKEVERRMPGVDGAFLRRVLFGKQMTFGSDARLV